MNSEEDKRLPSLAPGPSGPVKHPSMPLTKPRKNSTACLPCKQAKRKCTGRPAPCKACQNTEAECIFDETLDLRRKVAARRTLWEMEHYRSLLYSLLDSLRSTDEDRIRYILETVRNSSSLDPIAVAVDAPTMDANDTPGDDVTAHHWRLSGDPHSRITLEKLCDIPLFQVSAKPWTAVTNDDHLVSHLISLFFTWDHPLLQVVDQGLFLDHMMKNDTESAFCTPLLVNSILAVASCQGKRQASWMMLRQAVQLAQDFGMFETPQTGYYMWNEMTADMQYAGSITSRGLFVLNSQMSLLYLRGANLHRPRSMLASDKHHHDDIIWAPYPHLNQIEYGKKSALLRCVMAALASLSDIAVEIQDLLLDKALVVNIDEALVATGPLYARLDQWPGTLPDILRIDKEPIPQTLFVQYHHTVISLSSLLLGHRDAETTSNPSLFQQLRHAQVRSAKIIAQCLHIHRELYGLRQFSGQLLEPTCSSALVLIVALGDDESKDAFVEMCRSLVAFSKRFLIAKDMIQEIESIARRLGIQLPPEAVAVLDHKEQASSQWF
ncbi:hypothetical protein BDV59DRAFT_210620 [Aspergillus ambiguus]|uniref:putative C6 transcription factor n=1 Tax=Aspergillus ambiguus TaxID=176160 RepID=UPI003CCE4425